MPQSWSTFGLDLHLDPASAGGARSGLERALRDAIHDRRLAAGARIPSSRALAAHLGLSRGTVTAAYDQLVAEGYLVAAPGSGTIVGTQVWTRSQPAEVLPPDRSYAYDLRPGSPDTSSFPTSLWLRATRRALTSAVPGDLDYSDPRGLPQLREALAGYLGRTRGVIAAPDDIVVTNGSAQAVWLIATAVGQGAVAMEDPGLSFQREIVAHCGRRIVPLPVDEQGAVANALGDRRHASTDLAVVTPAHQYPLGVPMSAPRRRQLIAAMEARGGLVLEDDYDGEFRYDRQPVGALQGIAPDHVAYAGTSSKTLAPGLRLGWLVLPRRLIEPVVEARRYADPQTSALSQLVMAELIRSHDYDRHVRLMRARYRKRRDLLLDVLLRRAGRHARGLMPRSIPAGLQAVVRLPAEQPVIRRAAESGLAIEGLADNYHGDDVHQGIVIGFGRPSDSAYRPALEALAAALP